MWTRHLTWREIRWIPTQWSSYSIFWCRTFFFIGISQKMVTSIRLFWEEPFLLGRQCFTVDNLLPFLLISFPSCKPLWMHCVGFQRAQKRWGRARAVWAGRVAQREPGIQMGLTICRAARAPERWWHFTANTGNGWASRMTLSDGEWQDHNGNNLGYQLRGKK